MGNEEGGNRTRKSDSSNKAVIGGVGALVGAAIGVGVTILAKKMLSKDESPKPKEENKESPKEEEKPKEDEKEAPKPAETITVKTSTSSNQDDNVMESYCCPISGEIMEDPVITPSGITYDKKSIEQWLQKKAIDPLSKKPLKKEELIPNRALKESILEYKKNHNLP